jgi:hypothetical protein
VDDKCNKCSVDMPERHFVINTAAWRRFRLWDPKTWEDGQLDFQMTMTHHGHAQTGSTLWLCQQCAIENHH